MSILDVLVEKKVIKPGDVTSIQKEAESDELSYEQILISRGIPPETILEAKGLSMDIPIKSLKNIEIAGKILDYIPQESAEHYRLVPIQIKDGGLEVGVVDPDDIEA